jgi:DNA-binding protein Fis
VHVPKQRDTQGSTIREAISERISKPYEEALAGHINLTLDRYGRKIQGKKVCDVYYLKRDTILMLHLKRDENLLLFQDETLCKEIVAFILET